MRYLISLAAVLVSLLICKNWAEAEDWTVSRPAIPGDGPLHIDSTAPFVLRLHQGCPSNGGRIYKIAEDQSIAAIGDLPAFQMDTLLELNVAEFEGVSVAAVTGIEDVESDGVNVVIFKRHPSEVLFEEFSQLELDPRVTALEFRSEDELFAVTKGQLKLFDVEEGRSQVLMDGISTRDYMAPIEPSEFLYFPYFADGQCGRRIRLLPGRLLPRGDEKRDDIEAVVAAVLPGYAGTSGLLAPLAAPGGQEKLAKSSDNTLVVAACFERERNITCAIAFQLGLGAAMFVWKHDVLYDIVRLPSGKSFSAIQCTDGIITCIITSELDDMRRVELLAWRVSRRKGTKLVARRELHHRVKAAGAFGRQTGIVDESNGLILYSVVD